MFNNNCHIFLSEGCSTLSARQTSTSAPWAACVGLISHYDSLVRSGSLREDTQQRAALLQLEQLNRVMTDYTNIPIPRPKDCSQSQPTSELENKVTSRGSRIKLWSPEENISNEKKDRGVIDTQEVWFVCAKLSSAFCQCLQ